MSDKKSNSTIGEDLHDLAIKNSPHSIESGEMKRQVNIQRRNCRKCSGGSCIDPKEKKHGTVKQYSQFEIAVDVFIKGLKDLKLEKRNLSTYTDILLRVMRNWKDNALELEKRGLIKSKHLRDPKGKVLITSPWVVIAVEQLHRKEFFSIYQDRKDGKLENISRKDISSQISSIFSSLIKVFVELGLAKKVPAVCGSTKTYFLYEKAYNFSHEKLHHLFIEGRKLCKKRQSGEFGEGKVEQTAEDCQCERSRTIEIPGEKDVGITKKSIKIETDGTIVIEIYYQ